jgi:antitoxin CptB
MTVDPADMRRKRLLHRARYRGFKEADLIVGGYATAALGAMTEDELDAFEFLLSQNDHDIYAWVLGANEPPATVDRSLIAKMRAFEVSARA